jgi:hypothetical protein
MYCEDHDPDATSRLPSGSTASTLSAEITEMPFEALPPSVFTSRRTRDRKNIFPLLSVIMLGVASIIALAMFISSKFNAWLTPHLTLIGNVAASIVVVGAIWTFWPTAMQYFRNRRSRNPSEPTPSKPILWWTGGAAGFIVLVYAAVRYPTVRIWIIYAFAVLGGAAVAVGLVWLGLKAAKIGKLKWFFGGLAVAITIIGGIWYLTTSPGTAPVNTGASLKKEEKKTGTPQAAQNNAPPPPPASTPSPADPAPVPPAPPSDQDQSASTGRTPTLDEVLGRSKAKVQPVSFDTSNEAPEGPPSDEDQATRDPNQPARSLAEAHNQYGIKFTPRIEARGATDSGIHASDGGTFAEFDSFGHAHDIAIGLLMSDEYRNRTIDDALRTWSGGGYNGSILQGTRIKSETKVRELSVDQLDTLLSAIQKREGVVVPKRDRSTRVARNIRGNTPNPGIADSGSYSGGRGWPAPARTEEPTVSSWGGRGWPVQVIADKPAPTSWGGRGWPEKTITEEPVKTCTPSGGRGWLVRCQQ